MFLVREVHPEDTDSICELAALLNTVNLPCDRDALKEQIAVSVASFRGTGLPKEKSVYTFVLEDLEKKKVVGTSLIFAKHGTEDQPHTYLKVIKKVHEDRRLKIKKEHQLLRFEYDTDGPTEIGGLILHPDYRSLPARLGKQLSYTRFVYMAMKPKRFEDFVLAELLPPFREDGSSELWESFGRRFTGLDYREADRLSRTDRHFIQNLFPSEDVYTGLFNDRAQAVIGETGESSKPGKHMLEKIGFGYLDAVDPFDGGPHFGAKTKQIALVKRLKKVTLSAARLASQGQSGLLAFEGNRGFTSLNIHFKVSTSEVEISSEAYAVLCQEGYSDEKPFPLYVVTPV